MAYFSNSGEMGERERERGGGGLLASQNPDLTIIACRISSYSKHTNSVHYRWWGGGGAQEVKKDICLGGHFTSSECFDDSFTLEEASRVDKKEGASDSQRVKKGHCAGDEKRKGDACYSLQPWLCALCNTELNTTKVNTWVNLIWLPE